MIQPWDASTVQAIDKGIQAANLGLNPSVDGKIIRINLPDLTKERREELVKVVRKMAEDGRVSVRHVRREAIDTLKAEKKKGDITEDDLTGGEKEVQKLTDTYVKKIDDHLTDKEEEILTV
jgi:ribosome recycling factor